MGWGMGVFSQSRPVAYALIALTAISLLGSVYLYGENERLSLDLAEIDRAHQVSEERLNQTRWELNNASAGLVYLYGENSRLSQELKEINGSYLSMQERLLRIQEELDNASRRLAELSSREEVWPEERATLIEVLLYHHDCSVQSFEALGVQLDDLRIEGDTSPFCSFVMVYPEDLIPDDYVEAILRICRQARNEVSDTFGLTARFLNKQVLVCVFPSENDGLYMSGLYDRIDLILASRQDLTEYKRNYVYGFIHEVAHFYAFFGDEFREGWAIYAGSRVYSDVVDGLDESVWPTAINFTERIENIWSFIETGVEPEMRAARVLLEIDRLYGPMIIGDALRKIPSTWEYPGVTWTDLKQSLIEATGEHDAVTEIFERNGFEGV